MDTPNLNIFRVFDAAARQLSFTQAAKELNVTPAAVSQQIKILEDFLQVKLFERQRRGLTLTAAGHHLHRPVRAALASLFETIDQLKANSGRITLAASPSITARWLAPRLSGFAEAHPDIALQFRTSAKDLPPPAEVDFMLHMGDAPEHPGFRAERLAPIRMLAVAGPSLIARPPVIARAQFFAQYRLIEDSGRPWQTWFAKNGPELPHDSLMVMQTALAIDMAEAGEGIALVPDLLVQDAIRKRRLVVVKDLTDGPERHVFLLHAAQNPASKAREVVADWIRDAL